MYIQIKPIYKLLRFYINKKNSIFGYVYICEISSEIVVKMHSAAT